MKDKRLKVVLKSLQDNALMQDGTYTITIERYETGKNWHDIATIPNLSFFVASVISTLLMINTFYYVARIDEEV